MSLNEIELLDRRSGQAWAEAAPHHDAMREAYRWLLPEAYARINGGDTPLNRALYDHIFDETGMQALEDGANQIAEALHPWDVPWARWAARDDVPDEQQKTVQDAADHLTKVAQSLLGRSNFNTAAPTSHKDFLIGTAFLAIDVDPADTSRIRAQAMPPWQWALEADDANRVTAMFRKLRPRARELPSLYEDATFSTETARLVADPQRDGQRVDIVQAVVWDRTAKQWLHVCYETAAKHEVYRSTHRTPPVICYRSGVISGCAWGSGPGQKALPGVKVVNRVVELVLRNAAMAMAGMWLADDDGVVNPRNIKLAPGSIIPRAPGSQGLVPIAPAGKFDVSNFVLDDMRGRIQRAFYVVKIPMSEGMTAIEYQGRREQMLREMRGVYGQLRSEFAEAVMLRVLDLAIDMGALQQSDITKVAEVLLIGPLAQDVAGAEVDRAKQAAGDIASIAGPEIAMATINLDAFVPWVVQKRHADPALFKDTSQIQAFGQQVTQLAAQYHAAQLAQAQPAKPPVPQNVPQGYGGVPPQTQASALGVPGR